jgi:threonine aldolase
LPLHLDGARFANALVTLGVTPAEMTWKQGVDIVSFGGTKNGCWCAEALVFMNPDQAKDLPFIRKRAAQLFSKTRFIAAQFDAYLKDDLWLNLARHANAMTGKLAQAINGSDKVKLAWQPQANELFAILKKSDSEKLQAQGAVFYDWNPPHSADPIAEDETFVRLVTSFATTEAEIDQFSALIKAL